MNTKLDADIAALADMRLPELWALFAEVVGETTRCPNKVYLIRKVSEALMAQAQTGTRLRDLDSSQLRERYLTAVGRPTTSTHAPYLRWKIRQAELGRISVGPRQRREDGEASTPFKVIPLRLKTSTVEQLDLARERIGLSNRAELFRRAVYDYLAAAGEGKVAELMLSA